MTSEEEEKEGSGTEPTQMAQELAHNAERIRLLVEGMGTAAARWRPEPAAWSVLEVVCHLLDEERQDFRVRLGIILDQSQAPWPPIDPGG